MGGPGTQRHIVSFYAIDGRVLYRAPSFIHFSLMTDKERVGAPGTSKNKAHDAAFCAQTGTE